MEVGPRKMETKFPPAGLAETNGPPHPDRKYGGDSWEKRVRLLVEHYKNGLWTVNFAYD